MNRRLSQLFGRFMTQTADGRFAIANAIAIAGGGLVGILAGRLVGPLVAAAAVSACNYWLRVNERRADGN